MPGLHLYRSNRLEALAAILAEQLRHVGGDPFAPIEVVVGSRGMERHLRHTLSEHLGICANVVFPFPTAALDRAVHAGGEPGVPADPWSPDVLVWAVLEALPQVLADPRCAPLAGYVGDPAPAVDARTFGLARRLAELFDRYVTYRPELAMAWSEGATAAIGAEHAWQPVLWAAVRRQLGGAPHRAERVRAALAAAEPAGDAPPMRVFGLSSLPGTWLDGVGRLARGRDVELYLLCPSDQYWADLGWRCRQRPGVRSVPRDAVSQALRTDDPDDRLAEGGHPLLVSWGKVARDAQILLQSLPDGLEDRGGDLFLDPRHGAPDGALTALQRLQDDVLHAVHPRAREDHAARSLDPSDASIQLHACHGPTRQVEVLREVLLGLLDDDPTLQPRDIVVMTPDIEGYAPRVAAVFDQGERQPGAAGWGGSGTPRIPYEIADLTLRRLNPVADALLRVLALVDGRVTSAEVLDLLAVEPVATRFGVDAEDLATFRDWIVGSGVRWALDAEHRRAHEQPADAQNSWRFGLERLLLGVVLQDDGRLVGGVRPYDPIEGADVGRLGRLVDFCTALFAQLDALRAPRSLAAWADALDECVSELTHTPPQAAWLTRRVRDLLRALRQAAAQVGASRPVAVDALRAALDGQLEVASAASHGACGAVTFCGMVPERAVPYRVVVLLGMDEGAFPRSPGRPAFDLTLHPPRVGDRDLRDEDRYLMLEAVLSARQHLVVLYTGRDVRTNKPCPPAVPVSELCDALDATFPAVPGQPRPSEQLTRHHLLQAFDPRAFVAPRDGRPWAFDLRLIAPARASLGQRAAAPPFLAPGVTAGALAQPDAVEIDTLQRFWRQPVRAFLRQRLRLWLPHEDGDDLPEREAIELGWVDHANLLRALLDAFADGRSPDDLRVALRAEGRLPLGRAGDVVFDAVLELAGALQEEARQRVGWTPAASGTFDVDLRLGGARLVGHLDGCTDAALVRFVYGEERLSDLRTLLDAWIALLARCAQDPEAPPRALVVFGKVQQDGTVKVPAPVGLELEQAAAPLLARLVALRQEGLARPLPFFPKSSAALVGELVKHGLTAPQADPVALASGDWPDEVARALRAALGAALDAWRGGHRGGGDADDAHLRLAYRGEPPFAGDDGLPRPDFVACAAEVLGPVRDARRTASKLARREIR